MNSHLLPISRFARLTLISAFAVAACWAWLAPYSSAQTPNSTFLGTRWNKPGPKNAVVAPPYGAGEANWSIVAPGIATMMPPDADHPAGAVTLNFDHLLPPVNVPNVGDNLVRPAALFQTALNIWQAGSINTFTNLGQVMDGGGVIGQAAAASDVGDIRAAVLRWTQPVPPGSQIDPDVIAHAFRPDTLAANLGPGTIGGDVHFRPHLFGPDGLLGTQDDDPNGVVWVNSANAPFAAVDLLTVMIHEIGHAIGLGHNTGDANSVMQPIYAGSRRMLSATDMTNVQTLYGGVFVPEPAAAWLMGAAGLMGWRRRGGNHRSDK